MNTSLKDDINDFFNWASSVSPSHLLNHCIVASVIFGGVGWALYDYLAGATCAIGVYISRELQQYLDGDQDGITTIQDAGVPCAWVIVLYIIVRYFQ